MTAHTPPAAAEPCAMQKIQAHFHRIQQILRSLKGGADADAASVRARFAHHLQRIWALLSDLPLVILDDGGRLRPLYLTADQPLSPLHPFDRVRLKHLSLSADDPAREPARLGDLSDLRGWPFDDLMSLLQDLMTAFQQSLDLTTRLVQTLRADPESLLRCSLLLSSFAPVGALDRLRALLPDLLPCPRLPLPDPAVEKPN